MKSLKIDSYIDNTSLVTSNSIASIYIRHKIISGALASTIYTDANKGNLGSCSVGSIQGVWSDWIKLAEHTISIGVEINNRYSNDIIVISEVRYYGFDVSKYKTLGIFSTIAIIARVYLLGYSMTQPSNDNSSIINELAQSFPELLNKIKEIQNNLQLIKDQIENLDIKIKGVFQEQVALNAYQDAEFALQELQVLFKNEASLEINADLIFSKAFDISIKINRYLQTTPQKGDLSSFAIVTPLISTYSKVYTYSQRQKFINAGKDPLLAPNSFEEPLTKKMNNYILEIKSEFETLERKYVNLKDINYISSKSQVYTYSESVGFANSNIVPWGSLFSKNCSFPQTPEQLTCVLEEIEKHNDSKYEGMYIILYNSLDEKNVLLYSTKYRELNHNGKTYKGYDFTLVTNSNSSNDLKALKHIKLWAKSKMFFTQKDGVFFKEIQKFDRIIESINKGEWDLESKIVRKFQAFCPEHNYRSTVDNEANSIKEMEKHKKSLPGYHSNSSIIEIWE